MHFGKRGLRRGAFAALAQGGGELDIGGEIGFAAVGDDIFAAFGQHLEFMRAGAADAAGVGGHRAVVEA